MLAACSRGPTPPPPRVAPVAQPACRPAGPVLSKFAPDLDTEDVPGLLASLKGSPINVVSTTLAWRIVEPEEGRVDLAPYLPALDALAAEGYCLIVFLDSSGRGLINRQREVTRTPAYPGWLVDRVPQALAKDFFGGPAPQLDYFEPKHARALHRFYERTLRALRERYPDRILGVAPGIMGELEIKYYQGGFRWLSYTDAAQARFDAWRKAQGKPAAKMPVLAYGNPLSGGLPRVEPLMPDLMAFREQGVRDYACELTDLIRRAGFWAVGYFAQPLAFHDGIYATGVIERCAECFDAISIDYNFYNGYFTERRPELPAMLVDFALGLGYRNLIGGLYVERYRDPASGALDESILPVVKESIEALPRDRRILGLDIGGLLPREYPLLAKHGLTLSPAATPAGAGQGKRFKVGVLAARTNFLVWHGEWSNDRQLLVDALAGAWSALRELPDVEPHLLAESTILKDPSVLRGLDAVVLPHVTAVDDRVRAALVEYWKGGGRLVQDLRFDSFDAAGTPRKGELDPVFGIGGIEWEHRDLAGCYLGREVLLPRQAKKYLSFSRYAPREGHAIALEDRDHPGTGLVLRGPRTLAFGYLAQIPEDVERPETWRAIFGAEIRRLLTGEEIAGDSLAGLLGKPCGAAATKPAGK